MSLRGSETTEAIYPDRDPSDEYNRLLRFARNDIKYYEQYSQFRRQN